MPWSSARGSSTAIMNQMDDLPSYNESFGRPLALEHTHSQSDTSSSLSYETPPAFSISPITLNLDTGSTIIKPVYHESVETRALYELDELPNGRNRSIFLAEVPSITRLNKYGHLPQIEKRHHLYKISESQDGSQKYTAIDGRKTRTMHGTMLRSSADGTSLIATDHGDTWGNRGRLIYCARMNAGVMEWVDCKGKVVGIDHMALDEGGSETLQILVPMNRQWLDMLVAVWISRIQRAARQQRQRETEESVGQGDETRRGRRSSVQQNLLKGRSLFKSLST